MQIMFNDLTHEAQKKLLAEAGVTSPEDMHWDTVPVVVVELRKDNHGLDEDDLTNEVYGSDDDDHLD